MKPDINLQFSAAVLPMTFELPGHLLVQKALSKESLQLIQDYAHRHSINPYTAFVDMVRCRLNAFLSKHGEKPVTRIRFDLHSPQMGIVALLDFDCSKETMNKLGAASDEIYAGLEWSEEEKQAGTNWGMFDPDLGPNPW